MTHSIFEFADVDLLLREVEQLAGPIELASLKLANVAPDLISFFSVEGTLAVVLAIQEFTLIMLGDIFIWRSKERTMAFIFSVGKRTYVIPYAGFVLNWAKSSLWIIIIDSNEAFKLVITAVLEARLRLVLVSHMLIISN